MTKEEIYEYFYTNSANLGIKTILFCLLAGVLISLIIYITYYVCYKGVAYNKKFNNSLMIIILVSIVIMLMISSNIVISLGMIGSLSIVRFRTAIKDSRDTTYIFWAIAEGLSVGSQNFKLALVTTLFISLIMMITSNLPSTKGHKYLLVITGGDEAIDHEKLSEVMKGFTKNIKMRTANQDEYHQEYIFEITTKKELDASTVATLREIPGVKTANWIVESGDMVG